jgi:hypothetical protein
MHNDKELDKIYKSAFDDAIDHMRRYEVQAVAATYMAIAMRLYKTHLDEDEYKSMIRTIMETEVKPYGDPRLH